jgi:hypothetical protein
MAHKIKNELTDILKSMKILAYNDTKKQEIEMDDFLYTDLFNLTNEQCVELNKLYNLKKYLNKLIKLANIVNNKYICDEVTTYIDKLINFIGKIELPEKKIRQKKPSQIMRHSDELIEKIILDLNDVLITLDYIMTDYTIKNDTFKIDFSLYLDTINLTHIECIKLNNSINLKDYLEKFTKKTDILRQKYENCKIIKYVNDLTIFIEKHILYCSTFIFDPITEMVTVLQPSEIIIDL